MTKKFTKRQLMDQCGFTAEETQVILEYPKKLPVLVDSDGMDRFCINARDLWEQLNNPQGQFPRWVHKKFKPYGFVEDVDFTAVEQNCPIVNGNGDNQLVTQYLITVEMAKQLAMDNKKERGFSIGNFL